MGSNNKLNTYLGCKYVATPEKVNQNYFLNKFKHHPDFSRPDRYPVYY